MEEQAFDRLIKRRKKCHAYLTTAGNVMKLSDEELNNRLLEIETWETQVADMWTRLEMDCRKGDPSAPLKAERTPVENWFTKQVAPFFFLAGYFADSPPTENKS